MNNYLDMIMTNKIFAENSTEVWLSDDNTHNDVPNHTHIKGDIKLIGGNQDIPTGGFPPIIIIEPERAHQKEVNKNRELSNIVAGISIKDLLGKKKA